MPVKRKRPKVDQLTFDRHQWGGTRPGAGRKKDPKSGVSHSRREALDPHHPVHVTSRLQPGLRTMRSGLAGASRSPASRKIAQQASSRALASGSCE
jgi:hypothetical protein